MAAAFLRRATLLIWTAGLAGCGGSAGAPPGGPATPLPSSSPGLATIDGIVGQNYPEAFGVELAIYKGGALKYAHGYGLRDRGLPDTFPAAPNIWRTQPVDQTLNLPRGVFVPDQNTIFELASVSKEFTAAAILVLQQDGKLSTSDPLSKYFPTFPSGDSISVLQLIQHSSGLVDYNNFGTTPDFSAAYVAFLQNGQTDYQPIIDRLAQFPLQFVPGSAYSYSNSNYLLLGVIVAKVSGMPFGAFLQQRIFQPLGMTQTQQGYPSSPVTDFALGYGDVGAGPRRGWQSNLQWLAGPGGLTSTVGDLDKWDRAVRQPGSVFGAQALNAMFAPGAYPQSYGTYAAGWFISTLEGRPYVWHDGAFEGFQTMNASFPGDDIEIIILTNDGTGLDPYYMVPQLYDVAKTL